MKTLLTALCLALLAITVTPAATSDNNHYSTPTRIEEDNPHWNCHTMGNHTCGPVTP